jgi:copper(I)-binding protein
MRPHRFRAVTIVAALALLIAGCEADLPDAVPTEEPLQYQESAMGVNTQLGPILLRSVHIEAPDGRGYQAGDDARLWLTLFNEGREPDALTGVRSPAARTAQIRWDADCDGTAEAVPTLPLRQEFPRVSESPAGVPPIDAYHVALTLNRAVAAGTSIPVTFVFERAGSITVDTIVQPPAAARAQPTARCQSAPAGAPASS